MSSTKEPSIKELVSIAIQLAESLSERIPKSASLQRDCKETAMHLRTWRNNLPSEMEFLNKPTGDKNIYRSILSPLSELLCILCQLVWTTYHQGKPLSGSISSLANEVERKIKTASPTIKKFMDDIGVWERPRKGHAPLDVLFDQTSRSHKHFLSAEHAVHGHMIACSKGLVELATKIDRARKRHVGLSFLAGKAP